MARDMGESWIRIDGKRDGRAYTANVRHPLADLYAPGYDHHVAITLDYAPRWRTGLPKPKELARLQSFEARIVSHLEGQGLLAGSETTGARRTVHLYVRGGGPLLEMYRRRERDGKHGGLAVAVTHDPEWRAVAHLAQASTSRWS